MNNLLDPRQLLGLTGGQCLFHNNADLFAVEYEITNLRLALLVYKSPKECILDILN